MRSAIAALVGILVLAGCGALDIPYETATLEEALKGQVPSKTLRYRVPAPRIPVARRNSGIVREGNFFLVIVGPSLKSVVDKHGTDGVEYGIRVVKEPKTHLVLERVFAGGESIDLFEGMDSFRFDFPRLVSQSEIPFGEFPQAAPENLGKAAPGRWLIADLRVEKAPLPAELVEPFGALAESGRTDRPKYFLRSEAASFVVASRDPMTQMLLDFLIVEKRNFTGGVEIGAEFPVGVRQSAGTRAPVTVHWFHLGGPMYFQSR